MGDALFPVYNNFFIGNLNRLFICNTGISQSRADRRPAVRVIQQVQNVAERRFILIV